MKLLKFTVPVILMCLVSLPSIEASVSPLPTGTWEDHGFSVTERESIRVSFQNGIEQQFIPGGSMLLIHKGEVIFKEGFGVADLESKRPFTVDTPCRIASLTKPHTATMIALLVDQGTLSFEDHADTFIPGFANTTVQGMDDSVPSPTLAQCLSHTAGFASNNDLKAGKFILNFDGNLQSVTEELATRKLITNPGTNYAYSRLGYMTAGRIAEIVKNKSYQEVMKEVLFDRIGATASTFDMEAMKDEIPVPYQRTKSGLMVLTGKGMGTVINPGGNLISDLDGVARLLLLHRNRGEVDGERIISPKVLKQMYVAQPGTKGTGYGFGFNILKTRGDGSASRIQHTGASGTIGIIDFDLDLVIIILTQVPQAQTNNWRRPLLEAIYTVFQD